MKGKQIMIRLNVVCAVLLISFTCVAQTKLLYFEGLRSSAVDKRSLAYEQAQQQRSEQIEELVSIIKEQKPDMTYGGSWQRAVDLVGAFRAQEAVALLSEQLMRVPLKPELVISTQESQVQYSYPAARALVMIGIPSDVMKSMIDKVILARKREERELAAWVVMAIVGPEQAAAKLDERSKTSGGEAKQNLRSAALYIRNFKPTFGLLFARPDGSIEKFGDNLTLSKPVLKPLQTAPPVQPPAPAN